MQTTCSKTKYRAIKLFKEILRKFRKNKIVVYTAITGVYDELRDPGFNSVYCDYVCFTDNRALRSHVWKIRYFDDYETDNVRKCRRVKILPHLFLKDYEYSVWMDASMNLQKDVRPMLDRFLKDCGFAVFIHPERSCIYDEAAVCKEFKLDSAETINRQTDRYRQEGYPQNNGLAETSVLFRRHHDPKVIRAMEDWWREVRDFSRRDQLSFNYVAWKNKLNFFLIRPGYRDTDFFTLQQHNHPHTRVL